MKRRHLLTLITAAPLAFPQRLAAAEDVGDAVLQLEAQIAWLRANDKQISLEFVLQALGPRSPQDMAKAIFVLVQRVPYRLGRWTGDPGSLFNLGAGDCRHKTAAQQRLLSRAGFVARHVQVLFDWADLPLPKDMLALLPDTRAFHDTVEVVLNGRAVIADATWDPGLRRAGFPVQMAWDGRSATYGVTQGSLRTIRPGDVPKGGNLYDTFGLPYPVMARTQEFNRAFNDWAEQVRRPA